MNNFRRVRTKSDITITIICGLAAIALLLLNHNSTIITGTLLLGCTIILGFALKSGFRLGADETIYKRKSITIDPESISQVKEYLYCKSNRLELREGYGAILNIYYTRDRKKGYAIISKFSNLDWEEDEEMIQIDEKILTNII